MADITSADVAAVMRVEELFPNGFPLEQFAADQGIIADAVEALQTEMTLDGTLCAGFTPAPKPVNIVFKASSPTIPYLKATVQAQESNRRPYKVSLVVRVRATGVEHTFMNGYLKTYSPMPGIGRTLQDQTFGFEFERVE